MSVPLTGADPRVDAGTAEAARRRRPPLQDEERRAARIAADGAP